MVTTMAEMVLVSIALAFTLYIVLKHLKFKFPVVLLVLMIFTDISSFFLAWGLHKEENKQYVQEYTLFLSHLIGWTTFGLNIG